MNKRALIALAASTAALAVPASASAAVSEIAPLGTTAAGCPGFTEAECLIVVVRQTGFQAKVGTTSGFSTAPTDGTVVGWSISLAGVAADKLKTVSANYGGAPRAAVVVMEPLGKSQFKVVGKGPLIDLTSYLGTTPTFALPTALPIKKGQVVGITVPTWAPMISTGLAADTSWRSSKPLKEVVAKEFRTQRALVGDNVTGSFAALYQRARLAYSAVFIPNPPTKTLPKATPKPTTKK
ncbi:MAG: hypothetical protein Q7T55_03720 [Solirubrobacteraceae bacterium]|nr:hypothetical protein [Solirubrobacteraceae bacterium]